jgi:hypothetical protein
VPPPEQQAYRRPIHGGMTVTFGMREISLPSFVRSRYGGITVASGARRMQLPTPEDGAMAI